MTPQIALAVMVESTQIFWALRHGNNIITQCDMVQKSLSDEIFPLLQGFLQKNTTNIADITAIYGAVGPQAFTALRIGYNMLQGLAYSRSIPFYGMANDMVYALGFADIQQKTIIIDMRIARGLARDYRGLNPVGDYYPLERPDTIPDYYIGLWGKKLNDIGFMLHDDSLPLYTPNPTIIYGLQPSVTPPKNG